MKTKQESEIIKAIEKCKEAQKQLKKRKQKKKYLSFSCKKHKNLRG